MHVVTVVFTLEPGKEADFEVEILKNARASVAEDPGCRQFDVSRGKDGKIFLYEVYDDEASLKVHLQSQHYKDFEARAGGWVRDRQVEFWTRL